MATFQDHEGRDWHLELDIPTARRIRKLLHIDVLNFETCLPKLSADPILLCDVLWVIVEEQAQRHKVTDEQFGVALMGETLEAAADAFVQALIDFFPPRRRQLLTTLQETATTLENTLTGLATTKIPPLLQELQSLTCGSKSPAAADSSDTSQPAP